MACVAKVCRIKSHVEKILVLMLVKLITEYRLDGTMIRFALVCDLPRLGITGPDNLADVESRLRLSHCSHRSRWYVLSIVSLIIADGSDPFSWLADGRRTSACNAGISEQLHCVTNTFRILADLLTVLLHRHWYAGTFLQYVPSQLILS